MGKRKMKIPNELIQLLNELADQLRTDNLLLKHLQRFIRKGNDDLAAFVQLNIELTEDKWSRALERLEEFS